MLILVTGASGSGTSTLASALAAELKIACIEVDDYFWLPTIPPFTTKRDGAERLTLLLQEVRTRKSAVLAGSILDWGRDLEDAFDLIVFLYLDASIRVDRLKAREIARRGFADAKFLEWAAQYDEGPPAGRSLAKHKAWLSARSCPVLELSGDHPVKSRVAAVLNHMPDVALQQTACGHR